MRHADYIEVTNKKAYRNCSPGERFLIRTTRTSSCWLWGGTISRKGYGMISTSPGQIAVHRFAYELLIGPIPTGLELDHLCRVRHCVNPAHLEPVTTKVNVLRSNCPCAIKARMTHCINGHPLEGDNLVMLSSGSRRCRICLVAYKANWYQQKKKQRLAA